MNDLGVKVAVDATQAVDGLGKLDSSIQQVVDQTDKLAASNAQVSDAIIYSEAQQQRAIASMKKMADTAGMTKSQMMAYKAEQMGITAQTQAYIDQVQKIESKPINDAASAMDNLGHSSAGFNRELIVLGHEMSQGNFSRFGGSLMVLAERSNALSLIFSGTGLAIGAVAAGIGAFVVAAYQGEQELHKFNNELIATGGYAGLTKGSFDALSMSAASAAGAGIGVAKEAIQALAATGRIASDQMGVLGKAMLDQSRVTGTALEDIAKDYAKMPDGVAAWAAEHNKSMHFMSMAQYEHIKNLEDMGRTQEAMIVVGTALDAQFGSHAEHLTSLGKVVRDVTIDFSGLWDTMKHLLTADTVDQALSKTGDRVNELRSKIAELGKNGGQGLLGSALQSYYEGQLATAQSDQSLQQSKLLEDRKAAAFTAERAHINELGIAAKDYNDKQLLQYDKSMAREKELQAQRLKFKQQADAGSPVSSKDQSTIINGINEKYATKAPKAAHAQAASGYEKLIVDIDKYNSLSEEEASTGAKVSANDKWRIDALSALDVAYSKGQTSLGNYLRLWDSVQQAYSNRDAADQNAKELAAEASATDLASKEREKSVALLVQEGAKLDDQIRKQQDSNKSIGLNKDAIAALNAQREIDKASTIEAIAIKELDRTLDYAKYDATMKVTAGMRALAAEIQRGGVLTAAADTPLQKYIRGIADDVNALENVTVKAFKSMEDAFVSFAKTGKLDFSTMADGIISDLVRIQVQKSITGPMAAAMSSAGGLSGMASSAGSWISSLFSFDGGGNTGGGARTGGVDGKGGFMALLHPQETVIDHTKTSQMYTPSSAGVSTPNASQAGAGQASGGITVNVVESSSKAGTQQARQDSSGGNVIDVFVAQVKAAIASDISRGSGAIPGAMQQAYGMNRVAGSY